MKQVNVKTHGEVLQAIRDLRGRIRVNVAYGFITVTKSALIEYVNMYGYEKISIEAGEFFNYVWIEDEHE